MTFIDMWHTYLEAFRLDMLIFSFDSGCKNLGIAVLRVRDWRGELRALDATLESQVRPRPAGAALAYLRGVDELLGNIVTIVWSGTVDLLLARLRDPALA